MIEAEKIPDLLKKFNMKAILELRRGNFQQALHIFQKSLEFEEKLDLEEQAAQTLINIANTCYLLKKYEKAIIYLKKARAFFEKKGGQQE